MRELSHASVAMLLLPIVHRELSVACRHWRTYAGRVAAGGVALAIALYLVWLARYAIGGALSGMFALRASVHIVWAICVFGGISRTCDSLSAEKRSDTLGLLFLTHLRARDIVMAKLASGSLGSFYSLLGLVPILSIPMLLGGVAGTELLRITLVLLNSLFMACGIGLLVSALVRSARAAWAFAGGGFVFLSVALPVLGRIAEQDFHLPILGQFLRIPSPLFTLQMAFSTAIGLSTNHFWKCLVAQFGIGFAGLLGACLLIPYFWRVQTNPLLIWRDKFIGWTYGSISARVRRRTQMLRRNAFFWLSCRDRFAPLWPILFCLVLVGSVFGLIVYYEIPQGPACGLMLGIIAINDITVRLRVANTAAVRLAEDRQSGALELLLSTTSTTPEIIKGIWMAIRRIQLPAYCVQFLLYVIVSSKFLSEEEPHMAAYLAIGAFALISIGDFFVLGYVAMWKGMRVANPRHATGAALVRVLIVPWFIWLGFLPLINEVEYLHRLFDATESYSYLALALVIWAISSSTALLSARRNLTRHFREAATDRYQFENRFSPVVRWRERILPALTMKMKSRSASHGTAF